MQNLSDAERWLSNGISGVPLMLHGGSIETVFETVNNCKMPPGVIDIGKGYFDDRADGRLFFTPVTSRLGEKYGELKREGLSEVNRRECVKITKNYAESNAFHNCVASKLNCKKAEVYSIIRDWRDEDLDFKEIQEALKKNGLNLTLQQIIAIDHYAKKRKGVIIEPKKSILNLPIHVSDDDDGAVYVECYEGLDSIHINGIELMGPVEKRLMKRFLEGRLKYRGFKTEKPVCHQIRYFEI
jgi:hypothetical protein